MQTVAIDIRADGTYALVTKWDSDGNAVLRRIRFTPTYSVNSTVSLEGFGSDAVVVERKADDVG